MSDAQRSTSAVIFARHKIALLLAACAIAMSGCATTPPPQLPSSDVPAHFEQTAAAGAPVWPAQDWWRSFGSDELNGVVSAAQSGNLSLDAAAQRILQADARARQAGANLLPNVGASASAAHHGAGGAGTSFSSGDSFGLGLSASYELDFWGGNRAALQSAEAARRATAADRQTVALATVAGSANTYFQLLSLRERLAIARLNLENAQAVLTITQARVNDGIATPLELAQQLATVAGQQAAIPQLEQQELQTRNALAVLLGRPPEGFTTAAQNLDGIALPEVGAGLPSELLERRPDIVAAEASLQAAHADVTTARAALFPSIGLSAGGGLASGVLIDLLRNPAESFSFGASLAQTIFDAGARAAQTDAARAREQEILDDYRDTVITAFSDVENTLGNSGHLALEESLEIEQATQSQRAFDIVQARYREGLADYLTLLDAQRTLYQSRDQLGQIKLARLQGIVALYQALGGGWTAAEIEIARK